jgi:hypothetical protein
VRNDYSTLINSLVEQVDSFQEKKRQHINALKDLYDDIKSWIEPLVLDNGVILEEKSTFDFGQEFTELSITFTEIHCVTIRPHISYPQDFFYVHINYYSGYHGLSDLTTSSTNTTKLIYSVAEGWAIERNISFGGKEELFTETAFREMLEEKLLK